MQNRREFISTMALAGAAVPLTGSLRTLVPEPAAEKLPVRLFSKPLDKYDTSFMCECVRGAGIGGLDLTVRPGGKVEPAKVETDLPALIGEAQKHGLVTDMMVSGILSAADPLTERVLKTASASGIKYYRLNWFEYDLKSGVWESLQRSRAELVRITELNRKYNIHAGYQNHSGMRVGGPVWDLHELLRDLPAEFTGSQYDVRHAMVEGANTWVLGMRLIAPSIRTLAIKDFTWTRVNGKPQPVTVPLGEGMVDWDLFFKMVKELNLPGPYTLHIEYDLLNKEEQQLPLSRQQEIITGKIKKDMDFLAGYLNKYQLVK